MREQAAHKTVREVMTVTLDVKLQRAATYVLHDHVHRFVGAKKILHAHDVGMGNCRQRPAFLKEAFESVAKHRKVFVGINFYFSTADANHQRGRQILLDRYWRTTFVASEVDDRKPTR